MKDSLLKYLSARTTEAVGTLSDTAQTHDVLLQLAENEKEMCENTIGEKAMLNVIRQQKTIVSKSGATIGVLNHIIQQARVEAHLNDIQPWHVLLACYDHAMSAFNASGISRTILLDAIVRWLMTLQPSALETFCIDMTAQALTHYDPVIGRKDEIEMVIRILARRSKPNVSLIGEPGVGKSTIVVGLAQRIAEGTVPARLKGWKVYYLDLAMLAAGAGVAGEYEKRVVQLLKEIRASDDTCILFIDELHRIVGAGGNGTQDAANLLKPALARGDLHVIGATTLNEYREFIEKDGALERRFQAIHVLEPTIPQTMDIVQGVQEFYAKFHGIMFREDALAKAVELAGKYLPQRKFPDKALDILDEAASVASLVEAKEVTTEDICHIVSSLTGIPTKKLNTDEKKKLANIEQILHTRLIGQNEAVESVSAAIRRSRTGLDNGRRPIGSFIFLGPTGVGKTELAKTLAWFMFDNIDAVIRLDMSEYQEHHTVSRLFGSPPGYVGYGEGGQLTEAVRRRPYSVVLFDEIEKAHNDVYNVLLQILDEGRLTDSAGRVVDFTNTIIIMTSNIAPDLWRQRVVRRQDVEAALLQHFKPEFINRVDDLAVFKHLTIGEIREIADLRLAEVAQLAEEQGYSVMFDNAVRDHLAKIGFHEEFGARPLNRAIATEISNRLAWEIAHDKLMAGQTAEFGVHRGEVTVTIS